MKKHLSTFFQLIVYFGLPLILLAASFHHAASGPSHSTWLTTFTTNRAEFLLPLIFATVVMNAALIVAHHLREDQRLAAFVKLHLRLSTGETTIAVPAPTPRCARLASAASL